MKKIFLVISLSVILFISFMIFIDSNILYAYSDIKDNMVTIPAGSSTDYLEWDDIHINNDYEIGRYSVTINDFLRFLNDDKVIHKENSYYYNNINFFFFNEYIEENLFLLKIRY